MLIDFSAIPETVIPHMRGGEKEVHAHMFTDAMGKVMQGRLPAGASIGMHTHETNCEVLYVLGDGVYELLGPGACHYCPKGHAHSLINDSDGDLVFFAVVPEQ